MPEYTEIEDARGLGGMRLVLTAGVPGPFGEAAKAVFHVKTGHLRAAVRAGHGPATRAEPLATETGPSRR